MSLSYLGFSIYISMLNRLKFLRQTKQWLQFTGIVVEVIAEKLTVG